MMMMMIMMMMKGQKCVKNTNYTSRGIIYNSNRSEKSKYLHSCNATNFYLVSFYTILMSSKDLSSLNI